MKFNMTFNATNQTFETGLKAETTTVVKDHRELENRDALDSHPIKAITNLQTELTDRDTQSIQNSEIYKILEDVENGR